MGVVARKGYGDFVISAILVLGFVFLCLLFGLAAAYLPWYVVLVAVLFPLGVLVPIMNFELGLICAFTALFGIVPRFLMPGIPVGGVVVYPGEIIVIFLFLLMIIKNTFRPAPIYEVLKPISFPLLILILYVMAGAGYGIVLRHNELGLAELRHFFGLLALPVAIYSLCFQFDRVEKYVRWLAGFSALLLVIQTVSGVRLILDNLGQDVPLDDNVFGGFIRGSLSSGIFFVVYLLYYSFGVLAEKKVEYRLFHIFSVFVCCGAIACTFTRGLWLGVLAGLFYFFWLTGAHRRLGLQLLVLTVLGFFVLGGAAAIKPKLGEAIVDRFFSVEEEGGRGTSVGHRFAENEQALEAIVDSPLVGVGLGGEFVRNSITARGNVSGFVSEDSYIHNAFLRLSVKMGIFAGFVPIWLFLVVDKLLRSFRRARKGELSRVRLCAFAMLATFAAQLVNSMSQPEWTVFPGLVVVSFMLALILQTYRLLSSSPTEEVST